MSGLRITHLYKSFDSKRVLEDISFEISAGEIVAILGPSGCGKSTLLGLIAGLEQPDQGDIYWNGASLRGVPTNQRGFGLMFQDFALFPHKNVFDNVSFGLQMAGLPKEKSSQRVAEVLNLVGLPDFETRDVNTLSGGEGQRVALARSLAPNPRLLMLDEPLGSLDRALRERLVLDIRKILRQSRQTALYVTHDQEEAFAVADRIIVMNIGQIEQTGAPTEIYRRPRTTFVARLLGFDNLFPGEIFWQDGHPTLNSPIGKFPLPVSDQWQDWNSAPVSPAVIKSSAPGLSQATGMQTAQPEPYPVTVLLRPDSASLRTRLDLNHLNFGQIRGTLQEASFRGSLCRVVIQVNGLMLNFDFPSTSNLPEAGAEVFLEFDPAEAIYIYSE